MENLLQKYVLFLRAFVFTLIILIVVIASKWTVHEGSFKSILTVKKEKSKAEVLSEESAYKAQRKDFVYKTEQLFKGIISINERNCMKRYDNATFCTLLSQRENSTLVSKPPEGFVKRLPKALIIGVYKGGTREFIEFMAMHPMVKIQRLPHYEISYFSNSKLLRKGLEWYRQQMPMSFTGQLTIEKSPAYFSSATAPKEIYKMDPNIKLILLVREPTTRALSQFTFMHRNQNSLHVKSDFENCIFDRQTVSHIQGSKKISEQCIYIKDSMYSTSLKNYLNYFSLGQVHIIDSVEFSKNPCLVLKRAERFLQLEPLISCSDFAFNKAKGFFCVADPSNERRGLCYDETRGRRNSPAMQEKRKQLEPLLNEFFAPYNRDFFRMTNRTFNWYI